MRMFADLFFVSPDFIAILWIGAFIAGFIDAIAGGGGLIVLPALLLAGLNPQQALATNKVQGVFAGLSAARSYARAGLVRPSTQTWQMLICFTGGLIGACLITVMPTDALDRFLPVMMIGLALFFALRKNIGEGDRAARISQLMFAMTVVPAVGLYDGLFGPGAGTFFIIGYVTLLGFDLLRAAAHTKLLNAASNFGALMGFAMFGDPKWLLGISMGVAAIMGASLGAAAAVRVGPRLIRPLLVVTSSAMAIKLLLD